MSTENTSFRAKAFLFDLDGTLVNTIAAVEKHYTIWANELGIEPQPVIEYCHGVRSIEVMNKFAPPGKVFSIEETNAWEEVLRLDSEGVFVVPGIVELLAKLPKERWAIVTSGTRSMAETRLKQMNLPIPEVFITADSVTHGKPHPEGYLTAASRLGFKPEECMIFEDAPAGIEAGINGGIPSIATTTSYKPDMLQRAVAIIDNYHDIKIEAITNAENEMEFDIVVVNNKKQ
ncbi:putative phosphatase [Basidiobolus meristosporus CBS 931.73]|uniref:Putative phosphatase n=1 Tax=Basidiobolus meristosporus CBS 931.73 TaxID=1314790 RepID=A0A1Y1X6U5_9FUNG|nr:putative phosphatase [Basidiobolus meristosporus CBS 931.73]|eukprot:ORX81024.1 putative phosphatase [Basidiobolus meristosporus CBS 931.73]